MSGRRAKALRREKEARQLARHRTAQSWHWREGEYQGSLAPFGGSYTWIDGKRFSNWPTGTERYVFTIKDDQALVGTVIVEVHPRSFLVQARKLGEENNVPLVGPCLHAPGAEEVAVMIGLHVEPRKPLSILFALLDAVRTLELPTYALMLNRRTAPLVRRYLAA